jgi:hypothetical protein
MSLNGNRTWNEGAGENVFLPVSSFFIREKQKNGSAENPAHVAQ